MTCIFHVVSVVVCAVFTEQTPQHPLPSYGLREHDERLCSKTPAVGVAIKGPFS